MSARLAWSLAAAAFPWLVWGGVSAFGGEIVGGILASLFLSAWLWFAPWWRA